MITVHLITKNNEQTIANALESVASIADTILIGDLGSTDKTLKICRKFKVKTYNLPFKDDFSKARNDLALHSETEWNLYLHPWEILVSGHTDIRAGLTGNSYNVRIMQGELITKEIRIWKKLKFINPVYETLIDSKATFFENGLFYVNKSNTDMELIIKIINEWKSKNPTTAEPYYYHACALLSAGQYKEFINMAEHYLFREVSGNSIILIKYYLALVYLYHFNDLFNACKNIIPCIVAYPLMAEFSCLLGDILYKSNKYSEALSWYENAMILGAFRSNNDELPIEINKYKKYPEKMIESCQKMFTSLMTTVISS
jgi:glycosyltransferase involved in cell wall biosynthesis